MFLVTSSLLSLFYPMFFFRVLAQVFLTNKPTVSTQNGKRANSFATGRQNQDYDKTTRINLKFKKILPLPSRGDRRPPRLKAGSM